MLGTRQNCEAISPPARARPPSRDAGSQGAPHAHRRTLPLLCRCGFFENHKVSLARTSTAAAASEDGGHRWARPGPGLRAQFGPRKAWLAGWEGRRQAPLLRVTRVSGRCEDRAARTQTEQGLHTRLRTARPREGAIWKGPERTGYRHSQRLFTDLQGCRSNRNSISWHCGQHLFKQGQLLQGQSAKTCHLGSLIPRTQVPSPEGGHPASLHLPFSADSTGVPGCPRPPRRPSGFSKPRRKDAWETPAPSAPTAHPSHAESRHGQDSVLAHRSPTFVIPKTKDSVFPISHGCSGFPCGDGLTPGKPCLNPHLGAHPVVGQGSGGPSPRRRLRSHPSFWQTTTWTPATALRATCHVTQRKSRKLREALPSRSSQVRGDPADRHSSGKPPEKWGLPRAHRVL